MKRTPAPRIVIVGAGVSGLACGLHAVRLGARVLLIDRARQVGGRVATASRDGFLIDRGFQILLTAYPELTRLIDLDRLHLARFPSGAMVHDGRGFRRVAHPLRHPIAAIGSWTSGLVSTRDALAMGRRALRAKLRRPSAPIVLGRSVADGLVPDLSPPFVEGFLRSFFGGVFLDRSLDTDLGQFEFCLAMFAAGAAAVPRGGMAEIPRVLAADLPPGSLRLGTAVDRIGDGTVHLSDGTTESADAIVVAVESGESERLLERPAASPRPWRSTAMLAFDLPESDAITPWLMLDGTGRGPVNHASFISQVSPNYAIRGRGLLYANIVDEAMLRSSDEDLERAARRQLQGWFPAADLAAWRRIDLVRISHALPRQHPEDLAGPRDVAVRPGVYRCGDHVGDASLNGAMRSGRLAAEAAVASAGAAT